MKVYTKNGDDGTTGLLGGTRVPKHHLRIEAYGTVDELNSWLGMLKDQPAAAAFGPFIKHIQDSLFTLGSNLASDPEANRMVLPQVSEADVEALERSIDEMEAHLPPLKNFVLPGGHPANSTAHVARCVCRRAERLVVHLHEMAPVPAVALRYLNRLSDWLFVFGREMTHSTASEEIAWTPRNP
ncbi:MAG TPA: cob(I)yrinic acid a,c-diamide adenosyltransferase [Bacteroidia bacterium]|nr:cob(I)yrinic acid a,c-diamide adenosyltransferase [Bacteroidia bacterium]